MQSHKPHLPVGGRLRFFYRKWLQITSDPAVLDIVQGMHIELNDIPHQRKPPKPLKLSFHQFTKLLKPISAYIRTRGIIILTYIDDSCTVANTFQQCFRNICFIMHTFTSFGFLLNKEKSAPVPSHQVCSLGFYLNSMTMNITLPPDKISNVIQMCEAFRVLPDFTVLQLAQLIGTLVSLFPACPDHDACQEDRSFDPHIDHETEV